jgi:hypothetical protein
MSPVNAFVFLSVLLSCGPQGATPQARNEDIRVEVVNSANHRSVKGARVFVVSEEGKELAVSSTDERGVARLPMLSEKERPKYVLVEHPAFFLSGLRWQSGLKDYYILATVLVVR